MIYIVPTNYNYYLSATDVYQASTITYIYKTIREKGDQKTLFNDFLMQMSFKSWMIGL